ncbi:MAG: hypothetical protein WBC71_12895 [Salaquimonas sp.]
MRFIAVLAVGVCCLIVTGHLDGVPDVFNQSFTLVSSIISGAALAYVLGQS